MPAARSESACAWALLAARGCGSGSPPDVAAAATDKNAAGRRRVLRRHRVLRFAGALDSREALAQHRDRLEMHSGLASTRELRRLLCFGHSVVDKPCEALGVLAAANLIREAC